MIPTDNDIQNFMLAETEAAKFVVTPNGNGREGTDYILKTEKGNLYNLYLCSINLDIERDIKIPKHTLGDLKDDLWIALVVLLKETPTILYLIPSRIFETPDNRIFFDNEITVMPNLSNWHIKVFTNAIKELSQYEIQNIKDKL
ncbi:hypothetical protein [Sinomicrobium weinanense]|uniref:Uncharacterized protein n=1 Tax=Sinomicrobium weinanense TaxID=2842200 RepID=A0A926JVI6_9FLAO|nr:hypothetical protein [Sinomicrobium weinanense]MBC9798089.1 hypothetical protein [Sinomicrobium weinanense]MBU3122549.1 hypothetical protein [Sinomicrobium weinanense]